MEHTKHIFFCYSDTDRVQVTNMVETLETDHGIHCLLDIRDYLGGKPKINNVISSIQDCSKTVFVLSKAFCDSSWCEYEMLLALEEYISMGMECLVPIILEDCDIPQSIKPLTCLDTRDSTFWNRFTEALESGRHHQDEIAEKRPRLKIVSAPDGPVCTGFHTPHYPHPKSDHCIVLGIQEYEHTDELAHHDFTLKNCDYAIKLKEVICNRPMEIDHKESPMEKCAGQKTSFQRKQSNIVNNSNNASEVCADNIRSSTRFYRVWDGLNSEMKTDLVGRRPESYKSWMHPFWFRFFGKARHFNIVFELYKNCNNEENMILIDSLTVPVRTKGKRPSKRENGVYRILCGIPPIENQGTLKKKDYEDAVGRMTEIQFEGRNTFLCNPRQSQRHVMLYGNGVCVYYSCWAL
ncbi:uncharacterized protein LOC144444667 isoform X2 [Glandiceps talaboti]